MYSSHYQNINNLHLYLTSNVQKTISTGICTSGFNFLRISFDGILNNIQTNVISSLYNAHQNEVLYHMSVSHERFEMHILPSNLCKRKTIIASDPNLFDKQN